jgi:hypothetical protein
LPAATSAAVTVGEHRGILWRVVAPATLVVAALAVGSYFYSLLSKLAENKAR